jgi:conjugal transfer pilus assembly protein TraV
MSVSGVYETSRQNALPGQVPGSSSGAPKAQPPAGTSLQTRASLGKETAPGSRLPLTSGTPLRSPPRVLRIWLAPYEDSEGDLRDQTHIYVTLDRGSWQIEHTRRAIQDRFAPIRAIAPAAPPTAATGARSTETDGQRPPTARPSDSMPLLPGAPSSRPGSE